MRKLRPKTFLCLRLNLIHMKTHSEEASPSDHKDGYLGYELPLKTIQQRGAFLCNDLSTEIFKIKSNNVVLKQVR